MHGFVKSKEVGDLKSPLGGWRGDLLATVTPSTQHRDQDIVDGWSPRVRGGTSLGVSKGHWAWGPGGGVALPYFKTRVRLSCATCYASCPLNQAINMLEKANATHTCSKKLT
jgi:hypothetical protein